MATQTEPRLTLSEIREWIGYDPEVQAHGWPRDPQVRLEVVLRAVWAARNEHLDAAQAERELREGLWDLADDRPGDPVDDQQGEMPW